MRKTFFCLALSMIIMPLTMLAQGPNKTGTYYKAANGKKGQELKTALWSIIKSPNVTSYKGLIEAYKKTDTRPDGYVRDWYSNTTNYRHGIDTGSYKKEGDSYNKEHSVPQSWFNEASPMKSDVVHVIPTDGYVNNRRGNDPFGEVSNPTYQSNNGYSKLGPCTTSGYSGTVFEPNDEIKGDIARIYFYMVTCYEDRCTSWGNVFANSKYPGLVSWTLNMMLRWSAQDPVDSVENARNNAVQEVQGNRNPFVDYPGLEAYVWGAKTDSLFCYDNYNSGVTPIPDPDPTPDPDPDPTPDPDPDPEIDPTDTYIYNKVMAQEDLFIGGSFLIVCENTKKGPQALAGFLSNSNKAMAGEDVSILGTQITTKVNEAGKPHNILLGGTEDAYTLYDTADQVYLGLTSSGNALHHMNEVDEGALWTISITDGAVDILNNTYSDRYLRYNNSSPRFACYTSGQEPVTLYKCATLTAIEDTRYTTGASNNHADKQQAIFDLQGRKVGTVTDMSTLPRGVYVINGNKFVVK
ncbi:MAG: endonuclease [Prevotella sp.]|nr:endonuclease [Prevotella sp.]